MLDRPALQPSIALAAYAESLVDGQRVVVFGEATSNLPDQLLDRGARLVHVYDDDPTRAAEAAARNRSQNLWFAPLADGELALRERSFDLALVENLASYGDPRALLKRIRRTLIGRGAAVIACPNPDVRLRLLSDPTSTNKTLDYYALYDAVADLFPRVRMLGQMPFVGYALADFGTEREPEPTFDSGFVPGGAEEPEWFIALASEHPTRLDEFAVIQLPFRAALGSTKIVVLEQQLRTAVATERRSRERLAELEARVRSTVEQGRAPLRSPENGELADLRRELERRDAWILGLEARATAADERADTTQAELEDERAQIAELRRLLDAERTRAAELEIAVARGGEVAQTRDETLATAAAAEQLLSTQQQVIELELRAANAEGQAAELQKRLDDMARPDDATAKELATLEAQLAERGAEVLRLERDLREAERIGKELVRELRTPPVVESVEEPPLTLEELRHKLDALAALNAEREADLTAARWSIQALETRLEELRTTTAPSGPEGRLAPGEDASSAVFGAGAPNTNQAEELQRQAVLMEQIRSPRGA
jgi:SAM-dependent methyltransferase